VTTGTLPWGSTTSLRARMTIGFTVTFGFLVLLGILAMTPGPYYVARRETTELVTSAAHLLQREWEHNDTQRHVQHAFGEVEEDERLAPVSLMILDETGKVFATNHRPQPPLPLQKQGDDWITETSSFGTRTVVAGIYWQGTKTHFDCNPCFCSYWACLLPLWPRF